jgi:hypothetical protein
MTDAPLPADDVQTAYDRLLLMLDFKQKAVLHLMLGSIVSRCRSTAQVAMLNACEWTDAAANLSDRVPLKRAAELDGVTKALVYVAAEIATLVSGPAPERAPGLRPFYVPSEWHEIPHQTTSDEPKANR